MSKIYVFFGLVWSRVRSIKWPFLLMASGAVLLTAIFFSPFDHPSTSDLERIDKRLLTGLVASISENDIKAVQALVSRGNQVHLRVFSACSDKYRCNINVEMTFENDSPDIPSAVFLIRAHAKPGIDISRSITRMRREWNLRILETHWKVVLNSADKKKEPLIWEGSFDGSDTAQHTKIGVEIMSLLRSMKLGIFREGNAQLPEFSESKS